MVNKPCLMGINPETRECQIVCLNTAVHSEDIRQRSLICVPVSRETAHRMLGERIDDLYALAQQQDQEEAA